MSREEFMKELRALLTDLTAEEREEALQYYEDYFEDAGPDKEAEIIREFESPQKLAQVIKDGVKAETQETGEYRETGYHDTRYEAVSPPAAKKKYWTSTPLKIVLIALIIIFGLSTVVPIAGGVLCVVFAVLVAAAAIVFVLPFVGIILMFVGIVLIGAGITQMFYSLIEACLLAGAGFLLIAAGAVFTAFAWWLLWKVVPPVFRKAVDFCRGIFHRKEERR